MPIKLLLADDSVVIQKLVGLSFANEDIEIITVDNGDDAVTRARADKPDIVLADVVMPGKNGYEVCAEIRGNGDLASTPVLLLTGTFEAFDEGRAADVGATGHITKPFEAQALVDRVNEILSQRAPSAGAAEAAAPGSDFFDDSAAHAAAPESDFAFGSDPATHAAAPAAASATAEPSAETVAMPAPSRDPRVDPEGGDHTVAMIPDAPAGEEDWLAPPHTDIGSATTAPEMPQPVPTPNPDQTVLVDDFLGEPEAMPGAGPTPIGSLDLAGGAPAADSMEPFGDDSPADDLDLDDLSFGSQPQVPSVDLDGPSGDDTVLADDLFGGPGDFESEMPESQPATNQAAPHGAPASPQPPASATPPAQGLDIDFGGAGVSDSIVPENAGDYDVSASDLKVDPMSEDSSWGNGVPPGVQTGPAPITPPHDVAPPPLPPTPETAFDDTPSPGLEADWNPPTAPATPEPEPAAKAEPRVDLGATSDGLAAEPAPSPQSTGLEVETQPSAPSDLSPAMRDRIHDTLEKVAWEAFSDLSDDIVRQLVSRVEQIAWEVIPQMAETLIKEEIRRMKDEEGEA